MPSAAPVEPRLGRPFGFYLGLLLAMFFASGLAAVVYVQVQSNRDAVGQARADARFAAKTAAKQLGADVAILKSTVSQLAANPSIAQVAVHPAGCTLTFGGPGDSTQGHLDILRPDGAAVCSSRKPDKHGGLSGYAGERWVRRALRAPLFAAPSVDRAVGGEVALYAAPVSGKAIVAGFLDLTSLGAGLKAIYGGNRPAEFLVVARSHTIVARSVAPAHWVGTSPSGTVFARARAGAERRDLDGVSRIYASAAVPGTDWELFVGENKAEVLAEGARLRNRELLLVIASLALILLMSGFVYRRTVVPVKRLSAGVKATAAQDHDTSVPVGGPAEVAELATEINALIASVNTHELVRHAKDEAERANEAKTRFLSHMSHELRTPLAAVLGFAELLHRGAEGERERGWSRHVLDGGRHLLELVNELLEISRIEAGQMMLTLKPVDINRSVSDVLDLMAPVAADRGIQLTRGEGSSELKVVADALRLKQVLLNLVSNAIKYNREAGTVTITINEQPNGVARIDVADSGQGIPEDQLGLLFNPFERLGAEHSQTPGSGLGLVVTKGLIEAMDGTIGVTSTLGQGTTFTIELPLESAHSAEPGDREMPQAEPATVGDVLYIDDNPVNLSLVETVLTERRPGVKLRTSLLGGEGAELAQLNRPDILLLDLNLPDIAGEEVLRRLRAQPNTADVPVVILSADSTSRNITRLLQSGADAYLTKPFEPEEFLGVLDRLLPHTD